SGATCFAVFDRIEEADAAMLNLSQDHPDWWARTTLLGAGS
ncbi:MAG: 4-(cytidine 5'-diphospho)-2-C-methyl-D-erythritol kinase, partial [Pseudomonadota bacterium]